jgi:hypothetical protein
MTGIERHDQAWLLFSLFFLYRLPKGSPSSSMGDCVSRENMLDGDGPSWRVVVVRREAALMDGIRRLDIFSILQRTHNLRHTYTTQPGTVASVLTSIIVCSCSPRSHQNTIDPEVRLMPRELLLFFRLNLLIRIPIARMWIKDDLIIS